MFFPIQNERYLNELRFNGRLCTHRLRRAAVVICVALGDFLTPILWNVTKMGKIQKQ